MFGEIIKIEKVKDELKISKRHNSVFNLIGFVFIIIIIILLLVTNSEDMLVYLIILPFILLILNTFKKIEIRIQINQISIKRTYSGFVYQKEVKNADYTNLDFIIAESVDLEEGREYEFYIIDKDVKIKF